MSIVVVGGGPRVGGTVVMTHDPGSGTLTQEFTASSGSFEATVIARPGPDPGPPPAPPAKEGE